MRRWVAAGLGLLLAGSVAASAIGQAPASAPHFAVDYPDAAWLAQANGEASISCKVDPRGGLFECALVHEAPAGLGFGEYLMAMAPRFVMKSEAMDQAPADPSVTVPLYFRIPRWVQDWAPDRPVPIGPLNEHYPDRALRMEQTGEATVDCIVMPNGRLADCQVLSETPAGFGFGLAATRTATQTHRMKPDAEGRMTMSGQRVQLPVRFALE